MQKRQDGSHKQNSLDKAIRRTVDAGFSFIAFCLALKMTGTYAAVNAFLNVHSGQLISVFLVFVLLDIVLSFAGAAVKGLLSGLGEGMTNLARVAWARLKRADHPAV